MTRKRSLVNTIVMRNNNCLIEGGLCLALGLIVTFLLIKYEPNMQEQSLYDYLRIVLPVAIFVGFILWIKITQKLKAIAFFLIAFSLPVYVLVVNWLAIFVLTDYRSHHSVVVYSLSAIYLLFYFAIIIFGRDSQQKSA